MRDFYRDGLPTRVFHTAGLVKSLTCIGPSFRDRGKSVMHSSREGMGRSLLYRIPAQRQQLIS